MPDVHPFLQMIRERVSVERFDPERSLTESQIRALVEDAAQAPSSFNIQHWRFVAVRRAEDKRRLQQAAYGQQQVADAAVTFIVLGDLEGVEHLPGILDVAVEQGRLPKGKARAWIRMANEIYSDPAQARDEAIRSACLASMVMMLAAEARGLAAGALSGFDEQRVRHEFEIRPRYFPVMLLAVGYPLDRDEQRKPRMKAQHVLAFDSGRSL